LRPERITDARGAHGDHAKLQQIEVKVDVIEPTGPDTLVFAQVNGKRVVSRVHPASNPQPLTNTTLLFDTSTRFNALGNSVAFSPAMRHIFASGNLEGVQGDFYWNRGIGYVSPNWEGLTGNLMYAQGNSQEGGDLWGANLVYSRGLFAAALSAQNVHVNDGIYDPTDEQTWQLGATYNFGWARLFGLYTHTDDKGLDVQSNLYSAGAIVPVPLGTLNLQAGYTKATGPAVDRKHTSISGAYLYAYNSVTDIYVVGMNDRISGQTEGISVAIGVRYRF